MVRMVLHEWAYEMDSDEFVHISDAIPSKPYRCTKTDCGLEVWRWAGSKEPHFHHINPEGDISCEGGEGPRHLHAKNMIAECLQSMERVQSVRIEQRVGRYVVDIFIQTQFGPFYIEVIDSHPPEDHKWKGLDGRIIPFWLQDWSEGYEPYLGDLWKCGLEKEFFETMAYHFSLIANTVNKFSGTRGLSVEESWEGHMDEIFMEVQDSHRKAQGDMPTLWGMAHEVGNGGRGLDEYIVGYKSAKRSLLRNSVD